jgi:hypothetical protein
MERITFTRLETKHVSKAARKKEGESKDAVAFTLFPTKGHILTL